MDSKISGLFINNKKAQDSIYESGVMVFDCLKLSKKITLDYIEISETEKVIPLGYHFYFFNYHPSTMSWLNTRMLKKLDGVVITMVLEVLPNDPFVMCPRNHFDYYCVLDPSLKSKRKEVVSFPRPLEYFDVKPYINPPVPIIGSFGFATKGKGFQHVVEAVNREFDNAIVRINIPYGDFVTDSRNYSHFLEQLCKDKAKEGIQVTVTHDYMSKSELVDWCSQNTLNCFLYDRNMPGLAATTDQAIVTGRPLAVSCNDTFRHILSYLPPYPDWSLKQSINESAPIVERLRNDWSPERFLLIFEGIVANFSNFKLKALHRGTFFTLPVWENNVIEKFDRFMRKLRRRLTYREVIKLVTVKGNRKHEKLI